MRKRHIIALLCMFTLIASIFNVCAEVSGVSGVTCSKSGTKLILRWSQNPQDLVKNMVYIEKNGEELTPVDIGTGKSTEITPFENGDDFVFTVRSYFSDETTADVVYKYFVKYNDTEAIPDWTVGVSAKDGDFGITNEDAYDSFFASYIRWDNAPDEGVFNQLSRRISFNKDIKYRVSFRFKTVDYKKGDSFIYDDEALSGEKEFVAGEDFENDTWSYFETDFECTQATFKNLKIKVFEEGTLYIDDFRLEIINDEGKVTNTVFNSTFERDMSAKNFTATISGSQAVMTWTNPTEPDFLYNEIYETNKGVKTLLATLENGETTYTAPVNVTGGIRYTLRSCYEGDLWGETHVEKWITLQDKKIMPGWTLDIRDKNVYDFRGSYEITTEETHSGDYAAKFSMTHGYEDLVYISMWRDFVPSPDKNYCMSFWFKTEDYKDQPTTSQFSYVDFNTGQQTAVKIGNEEYQNGEWYNKKIYFKTTSANAKRIIFYITTFGTIYIDDIEVYEVDENNEKTGENLIVETDAATDGGFEYSGFTKMPAKPTKCEAKGRFRGAEVTWNGDDSADKIRIYEGENLVYEGKYIQGVADVKNLTYGLHTLDVCAVSSYGVESDRVSVEVSTLPNEIGKVSFSKNTLTSGKLTARAKIENDVGNLEATLVLALYRGNVLEKIEFVSEIIGEGEGKNISAFVEVPSENTEEYLAAAYIWDKFFGVKKIYAAPKLLGGQNE